MKRLALLSSIRTWGRYVQPGLQLKRWLLLLFGGVICTGLGAEVFLQELYTYFFMQSTAPITSLSRGLWGGVLAAVGSLAILFGLWQFNRSFVRALLPEDMVASDLELLRQVVRRRTARQGPRIVTIGGGTGMPTLLRGLRAYTDNITAIVTVADDGGSSGRLREQMGMLPPGDFRNNMAALSDAEELMTHLLQYRFSGAAGLDGHNMGNLFIAAMAAITGSFESGIAESSRVLAVKGRVLPSTLEQVTLCAELAIPREDGSQEWRFVRGESQIAKNRGRVIQVMLEPADAQAYPEAIRALLSADLIIAGPGSFYTSVIPNLLVPSIREAIRASRAQRIFVCNVANEPGETTDYGVDDYMRQLQRHARDAFTSILANHNQTIDPAISAPNWVALPPETGDRPYNLYTADLLSPIKPTRHDSAKLAQAVMQLYQDLQPEHPTPQNARPTLPQTALSFPGHLSRRFRSTHQPS